MARPTVHDIANEAGVSLATVDRVLNGRPGVREKTVNRVQEAIRKLGYVRDTSAANLARQREYRFVVLLPKNDSQFVETLREALVEASGAQFADRVSLKIMSVMPEDPHAIAQALHRLRASRPDGVAIMAQETPQVRDAIARLKADGIAVSALIADLPSSERDFFVGVNSQQAGRTAGLLIGRFVRKPRGKVLVIANSMIARDSIDRRLGFDSVIGEEFAGLQVLPSVETHDDPARARAILHRIVAAHSDLVAVYSMGTGNRYILDALRETGRLMDLVVVGHELTPRTRDALLAGEMDAVIAQNVGHLARSTLRVLRAKCDSVAIFEAQERIRIDIVTRENLP
ncbi:MAG: LacI family DNA-binding transcriptional regulator [Alphaproteobacteria bacterium]|nr:LacI family DNA-binding transcriptional regulator [Alphaproteobacteria bacterium]